VVSRLTKEHGRKVSCYEAAALGADFLERLAADGLIVRGAITGSVRRQKPVVNDLDLVVIPNPAFPVPPERPEGMKKMDWELVRPRYLWELVRDRLVRGGGRALKVWGLLEGVYTDVLFTTPESWGAALMHTTGPKELNIAQRARAAARGLTLNEYGLFRGSERLAGASEEEIYEALQMPWLEPVERR